MSTRSCTEKFCDRNVRPFLESYKHILFFEDFNFPPYSLRKIDIDTTNIQ